MASLKVYFRGESRLVGLDPSHSTEAPSIAGGEPWESVHRGWLCEIVSSLFGKGQEFCSDLCTDDVPAVILGASAAEAIAVEASHGRGAAELQGSAQHI